MNEIKIFENKEFGEIRTLEIDGKPYFVASDIAKIFGYAKPNNAVSSHCRSTLKQGIATKQGNFSEMLFIPEGDVYRLIMKSKPPSAAKFESWVFDEVLPTIILKFIFLNKRRKHKMNKTLKQNKNTITALEIAEMLGMKHYKVLKKLEGTKDGKTKGIIDILDAHDFVVVEKDVSNF